MDLLDHPHHDGSALHVAAGPRRLGHPVRVRVRVPHASAPERLHLRTVLDGEPRFVEAHPTEREGADTWWAADLPMHQPMMRYRFLLEGGAWGYAWLNAAGMHTHDVPDVADFTLTTYAPPPDWLAGTVLYQIFPDRFARSGPMRDMPDWAMRAEWSDPIPDDWRDAVRQIYGGDLPGIEAHLDHLVSLGVNAVYLTPFFAAPSSHRYNASTFEHVDPLLGGDAALASLIAAAHARGIRVIGDLTTNHSGDQHAWFRAAQADAASPEAGFYFFEQHPDEYVGWFGVRSLPKFDLSSPELRHRLVSGADSVVARWMGAPYGLDGWRIDVANMTGRLGEHDLNHDVALDIRATMADVDPDSWLVAEHCYDASADLAGDGWHGTMAYSWFTRPVWCWLRSEDPIRLMGFPSAPPSLAGPQVLASIRAMTAVVPWQSLTASMTLLDSHDTARFASVAGSRDRHVVALTLLMAFPGVPMVFAGDEVGVRGDDGDQARAPFPWDESQWDKELLATVQDLIAVRRASDALCRGGLRWVSVGADHLTFLRESPEEQALVHLARAPHAPVVLACGRLGVSGRAEVLFGTSPLDAVDARFVLPGHGPAAHIWRLEPS